MHNTVHQGILSEKKDPELDQRRILVYSLMVMKTQVDIAAQNSDTLVGSQLSRLYAYLVSPLRPSPTHAARPGSDLA